jgi:hypothetical protein
MTARGNDLHIRSGRIRQGNRGCRCRKTFVGEVRRVAKKAGHRGNSFDLRDGYAGRSTFGRGSRAARSLSTQTRGRHVGGTAGLARDARYINIRSVDWWCRDAARRHRPGRASKARGRHLAATLASRLGRVNRQALTADDPLGGRAALLGLAEQDTFVSNCRARHPSPAACTSSTNNIRARAPKPLDASIRVPIGNIMARVSTDPNAAACTCSPILTIRRFGERWRAADGMSCPLQGTSASETETVLWEGLKIDLF